MRWGRIGKPIFRLVVCIAAVLAVTVALYAVPLHDRPLGTSLSFLFVVLIVAARWGFRYSLFTSFLAALGFSWLLPPVGRFWLSDSRDVFVLAAFLVIGITTSYFSDRARREAHNRISEQKRAEEARLEIEEQWRAAFESNPTMYFIVDAAGVIASVNAFGAEQLGYTASELIGQPVLNVFHEPDRQAVQGHAKDCFEQPGRMLRWEARKIRKDGTMIWVRETANVVVLKKRPVLLVVCENITEQKRAEQALKRSEAYLTEAQRLTRTGSWAWDPRGDRMLYCSEEIYRIFGFEPQKGVLSTEVLLERLHPEDRERVRAESIRGSREKTEHAMEYRLMLPDGTIKYVQSIRYPVFDGAGELVEVIGTTIDVTERKRAEETLRRNEAYLADAQRLSHTGSWAWSPVTRQTPYWSEEMFRIFGFDSQHGPPTTEEFRERVHPEDRDSVFELMRKAAREKTEYEHDHRIVLPDGTIKHIHALGHPVFNGAGELAEFVGTAVDVTERKRAGEELRAAETRFRTSVDHLTDALFIHDDQDEQGRIIDVNQQACDSLGYTREELIGMTAFDYDPLVDATFVQSIKERLARGETLSFETVHRRKDGTTFPVELRARPFWHGNHRFGLALARDITDRKRAEQERERLRQLEADLAHINRVSMMGELAASLAHEIKQPIAAAATNVGTILRWLQRQPPEIEEARETAARIAKDVNRAAEIINRVRSLYTKGDQQRERLDVNQVIEEMITLLHDEASRYSILIQNDLAGDLPKVNADRVQLQQVFMNLMLNGIEAIKGPTGELTVKSERTANGQVLISVSDTGQGLPKEKAEQIFEAFFTTKPQGTGMGLTITRSIIEAHGGRLWASANTGRGATFHFTLPIEATASSTSTA
jgi:PAS domain S-box-containing protein